MAEDPRGPEEDHAASDEVFVVLDAEHEEGEAARAAAAPLAAPRPPETDRRGDAQLPTEAAEPLPPPMPADPAVGETADSEIDDFELPRFHHEPGSHRETDEEGGDLELFADAHAPEEDFEILEELEELDDSCPQGFEELEELDASPPGEDNEILRELEEVEPEVEPRQPEVPATPKRKARLGATEEAIDREIEDEISVLRLAKATGVCAALALPIPLLAGWPYYSLSLAERPLHSFHPYLRPSGLLGLTAGILGTALIAASLLYLVRKRVKFRRNSAASLQAWMNFHIATGLIGPALVVLHSAVVPYSALGLVSIAAMLIVVMSGVAGRYLLTYMPKTETGEMGRDAVRQRLQVYRAKLIDEGLDPDLLGAPEAEPQGRRRPWLITSLVRMALGDRESRREFRCLRSAVKSDQSLGEEARRVLILVRRLCRERQLLVRYYEIRRIVGTWRFLHRWLAVVLVLGAFFHILVALKFGDLWILPGGRRAT